jgi:ATP/ADP translocase
MASLSLVAYTEIPRIFKQKNVFDNTIAAFIICFILRQKILGTNARLVNTVMNYRIP